MRATWIHGPGDIRVSDTPDPVIEQPTDAVVKLSASCICGSDLWPYRGISSPQDQPTRIGHEFCGIVTEVGADVTTVAPGQFVVGGFTYSDNTCAHCRAGVHGSCLHGGGYQGCQAEFLRVPQADGTLIATPEVPDDHLIPSLLTCSDVMATGWHAAVSAGVQPGHTVAVVGDGAVGLCGVLAASRMGAGRVIAMSRHDARQKMAREFGATDVVAERGKEGVERIMDATGGVGADAVLECVGTGDAMEQAVRSARPGARVGFVGVPHGVEMPVRVMFGRNVGVNGGLAPVRKYLPQLLDDVLSGSLQPGSVFDTRMDLDDAADGYRAMDERRAIKVLLETA